MKYHRVCSIKFKSSRTAPWLYGTGFLRSASVEKGTLAMVVGPNYDVFTTVYDWIAKPLSGSIMLPVSDGGQGGTVREGSPLQPSNTGV